MISNHLLFSVMSLSPSSFSGLVVSMLASVRGFKPGRNRWIFSGEKILSMPSFRREVKLFAPCRRFVACKKIPVICVEVGITGKIDRPFLARFRPSLTEVCHVAWHGASLEMTDGTKGGAQRAHSLRPRCFGVEDPKTTTHIYLPLSSRGFTNKILCWPLISIPRNIPSLSQLDNIQWPAQ
jgi:hypothetical protein